MPCLEAPAPFSAFCPLGSMHLQDNSSKRPLASWKNCLASVQNRGAPLIRGQRPLSLLYKIRHISINKGPKHTPMQNFFMFIFFLGFRNQRLKLIFILSIWICCVPFFLFLNNMEVNILGLIATALFIIIPTSFLLILYVKTASTEE